VDGFPRVSLQARTTTLISWPNSRSTLGRRSAEAAIKPQTQLQSTPHRTTPPRASLDLEGYARTGGARMCADSFPGFAADSLLVLKTPEAPTDANAARDHYRGGGKRERPDEAIRQKTVSDLIAALAPPVPIGSLARSLRWRNGGGEFACN
jgi:hypothetical protein